MPKTSLPILQFVASNYRNFNSRATRDALYAYWDHVNGGGKMYWAVAGAMSSAQLGITLAPAIRAGLVHGLSVTGANLEESLFRLVAHHGYKDFPEYRYFTKQAGERKTKAKDDLNLNQLSQCKLEIERLEENIAASEAVKADIIAGNFKLWLSFSRCLLICDCFIISAYATDKWHDFSFNFFILKRYVFT